MANSEKISRLTSSASFQSGDFISGVRGNTNLKFPYSALYQALSGLGSLKSVGGGSPILNQPVAGVNEIRTISGQKGVSVGLTAQGGIKTALQFTQSTGGEKIIPNLESSEYTIKTIKTTSPLTVESDDNSITISLAESPLAQSNTVIVSDITDFPDAVAGVITLEDDINYITVAGITTSNRFVGGKNGSLTANNQFTPVFSYTGSGSFFTLDSTFTFKDIRLSAPSGKVFDWSRAGAGEIFAIINNVLVDNCAQYGTFNNLSVLSIRFGRFTGDQGIELIGPDWSALTINQLGMFTANAAFIGVDFGSSVHQKVDITKPIIRGVAGSVGISGLVDSGNIVSGDLAQVDGAAFSEDITPYVNITNSDVRWNLINSNAVMPTMNDALLSFSGNATPTAIAATGVPVRIFSAWNTQALSRFTADANGTLTYIGERPARLPIDLTTTVLAAAGGDKQARVLIYIKGVQVADTAKDGTASSTKAASITTFWQHTFEFGDTIEAYVANDSGTDNLVVKQAVLRIN